MDIKEIALKIGLQVFEEHPYDEGHVVSPSGYTWIDDKLIEFAEALISAHKAELLKEVGEPVLYAEFAEDGGWLGDASEYADHLEEPHALFTSDQVAAAIIKATKPLEDQLAAAQEEGATVTSERDNLWFKLETAKAELADLRDQLAKAEQRVAEACALTYLEDYDLTDIAERVRAGEWRKFVKEM